MRMANIAVLVLVAFGVGLAGCSSSSKDAARDKPLQNRYTLRVNGSVIFSPNGEPLSGGALGRPSCVEAIAGWFDRVDTNHDGVIDRNELLSDARIQFLRMDQDGDGAIYPSELLIFRQSFQTAARRTNNVGGGDPATESNAQTMDQLRAMGYASGAVTMDDRYQKKADVADVSDPVMSADTNLDFKVSMEEFTAQAQDLFKSIDTDHDGKIERIEMLGACPNVGIK